MTTKKGERLKPTTQESNLMSYSTASKARSQEPFHRFKVRVLDQPRRRVRLPAWQKSPTILAQVICGLVGEVSLAFGSS